MRNELQNLLFRKFPTLYSNNKDTLQTIQFDCEDGWHCLAETLSDLIVKRSSFIKVVRVNKKQGRLRFHLANCAIKDRDFIAGATKITYILSGIICTECAERGVMFNGKAISSRCPLHCGPALPFLKRYSNIELPINTCGIGKMWHEMIIKLYRQIQENSKNTKVPVVVFTKITQTDGKLGIQYTGGNDNTKGMVSLLEAYSEKIDKETGHILNLQF